MKIAAPAEERREYASRLQNWDRLASVRTKPRRTLAEDEVAAKQYFPRELVPAATHPAVVAHGPDVVRKILIQRLYSYLDFTAKLEHQVVNEVTRRIAVGDTGLLFPEDMVFDAYKIYVDEGHHAFFSVDLVRQVRKVTGVAPRRDETPLFLRRLRRIEDGMPSSLRQLSEMFFTIVSETLITGTLAKIPRSEEVVDAVRELVADHAEDEGRHHAYFSSVLEQVWPQLPSRERSAVGPLLPEFIFGFLEPDCEMIIHSLTACGLTSSEAERVVEECYPRSEMVLAARDAAKATLRLLERTEVLDEPRTREAFERSGPIK